jgi:uncharacterized protein YjcR
MPHKPKPSKGKRPGAQPGNTNALRHGFYSKAFTADQSKRLDAQKPDDVLSEINLLRVCIDNLQNELSFDEVYFTDQQGNTTRDDHYLKAMNTLSTAVQSLATLVRTHHLIHGKGGDVQDAIEKALERLRLEMGI